MFSSPTRAQVHATPPVLLAFRGVQIELPETSNYHRHPGKAGGSPLLFRNDKHAWLLECSFRTGDGARWRSVCLSHSPHTLFRDAIPRALPQIGTVWITRRSPERCRFASYPLQASSRAGVVRRSSSPDFRSTLNIHPFRSASRLRSTHRRRSRRNHFWNNLVLGARRCSWYAASSGAGSLI